MIRARSSWYSSKFHIVQQIVLSNVYLKLKLMYHTVLISLQINFLKTTFVQLKRFTE